eukprot:725036_1
MAASERNMIQQSGSCYRCGNNGMLIDCDGKDCLTTFHPWCTEADGIFEKNDIWKCPDCADEESSDEHHEPRARIPDLVNLIGNQCSLCRDFADHPANGVLMDDENDFVGPWNHWISGETEIWVHRQCAMWAPERGASIGCIVDNCKKSYHMVCAKEANCWMDWDMYNLLCSDHYMNRTLDIVRDLHDNKCSNLHKHCNKRKRMDTTRPYTSAENAWGNILQERPDLLPKPKRRRRCEKSPAPKSKLLTAGNVRQNDNSVKDSVVKSDIPSDVQFAGLEKQLECLKEFMVMPLLYPEIFHTLDIDTIHGVLLFGPTGSGKTLLARVVASYCKKWIQAGISFFARNATDLVSKFHGETERAIRELFIKARSCKPAIIFFDEFDALAPIRSAKKNQVHSSAVTTLLTMMDTLGSDSHVFVLAATNRVENIDPALRRPGRFGRQVLVDIPDFAARKSIFDLYTCHFDLDIPSNMIEMLAKSCTGFSGADIKDLCNRSFLIALQESKKLKIMSISSDAKSKVIVLERHFMDALSQTAKHQLSNIDNCYTIHDISKLISSVISFVDTFDDSTSVIVRYGIISEDSSVLTRVLRNRITQLDKSICEIECCSVICGEDPARSLIKMFVEAVHLGSEVILISRFDQIWVSLDVFGKNVLLYLIENMKPQNKHLIILATWE